MQTNSNFIISLESWIIQDGNYGDFAVGEEHGFALEFWVVDPANVGASSPAVATGYRHLGCENYSVVARTVFVGSEWWAIDFGVPAYTGNTPPKDIALGGVWQGRIGLGIDYFDYFERLAFNSGAPPLIYDWRIDKIEMQTAPFIEKDKVLQRDPQKLGWREIQKTDAWQDDGSSASYLLHCTRVSDEPRHAR